MSSDKSMVVANGRIGSAPAVNGIYNSEKRNRNSNEESDDSKSSNDELDNEPEEDEWHFEPLDTFADWWRHAVRTSINVSQVSSPSIIKQWSLIKHLDHHFPIFS